MKPLGATPTTVYSPEVRSRVDPRIPGSRSKVRSHISYDTHATPGAPGWASSAVKGLPMTGAAPRRGNRDAVAAASSTGRAAWPLPSVSSLGPDQAAVAALAVAS